MNKVLIKLLIYRLIFAGSYISFIGISLFIHFYLGHQISEIENWLYHYSGMIIILISSVRLLTSYLSLEKTISVREMILSVVQSLQRIHRSTYGVIFLIGLFMSAYFYYLSTGSLATRDQLVPRAIVLFFVIGLDVLSSHLLLIDVPRDKVLRYGFFDCLIVLVGIFLFYQNLHLNLIFMAFYFGCYSFYLITQNIGVIFLYWVIVLLPTSIIGSFKVDFFSVDYQDIFSVLIVILGHLIPYTWLHLEKERVIYGTRTT